MKEKKQNDVAVLLGYAGSYKGLTFTGLGLSAVAMILGMAPYVCIWLVARDLIAAAPDWTAASGAARYGWMAFIFAVAGIAVYFAALMCTHLAAFRTASNIRKQGMAHLMRTPLGFFDSNASGLLRNRLGVATTILTGVRLILSGQIDFMMLFLFLLVITRVYAPFDQALALIAEMFMSQVSANRLTEIYDTKTAEGAESFKPAGHDIVFDNVGFAYDDEQVLRGVSFTAKEGEVTALVGPSGSGKSTCARLAARLWDVSAGSIKVGGVDISTVDPEVLLSDYSMVFQDVVLFDDTVMENIRLGKHSATDAEVLAAAAAANCDEFVEKLPQGYRTPIGENGAKLSGGERQRISIARALLKNAPIVLLDEATASLDVENETRVQGALSRLLAGKTVLVIAHRMRTVEAADKIVVLADGKVAEEGSPAELLAKDNGMFRRMTQLQSVGAGWSI